MILLLNLLPFAVSLCLLSIGWHDHRFPDSALVHGLRWWFIAGGFFIYMAAWNGWDRYRSETQDPLAASSSLGLWWFKLTLIFPVLTGVLVPIVRLLLMSIAVDGLALLIQHLRA